MTIRQKKERPDSSRPRGDGSKCFQWTQRLSAGPRFLSDEPIKSPYIPPLLMTDKPPGKLQSDLENERESARRGAARLAAIVSS